MKTAYIEFNTSNHIKTLNKKRDTTFFSYQGIDFFPDTSVTSLLEILKMNYHYFVIDIGVLNTYTVREFLRCDQQFLIRSQGKWRLESERMQLANIFKTNTFQDRTTMIQNLSGTPDYRHFPFIENPFHIKTSHFHVISQILERN